MMRLKLCAALYRRIQECALCILLVATTTWSAPVQDSVEYLIRQVRNQKSQKARIATLRNLVAHREFHVYQIRKIYRDAFKGRDRFEAIEVLVPRIIQYEDASTIVSDFTRKADRQRVSSILARTKNTHVGSEEASNARRHAEFLRELYGRQWLLDREVTERARDGYRPKTFKNRYGFEIDPFVWMQEFTAGPGEICAVHMAEYPGGFSCRWDKTGSQTAVVFESDSAGQPSVSGPVTRTKSHLKVPVPLRGQMGRFLYFAEKPGPENRPEMSSAEK